MIELRKDVLQSLRDVAKELLKDYGHAWIAFAEDPSRFYVGQEPPVNAPSTKITTIADIDALIHTNEITSKK